MKPLEGGWLLLGCLLPLAVWAQPLSLGEKAAALEINPAELSRHIRYLASDALEGRGPGSPGDRLAQEYVLEQLRASGLKPVLPSGEWLQSVPLLGVSGHPETCEVQTKVARTQLVYGTDFIAFSGGSEDGTARWNDAPLVFVGYGIVAPEFDWNDYKGVDLRGKVLLVLNSDPEDDPALFGGKARLRYGRWDYKYEMAAKQGAVGALILHTPRSAGYPWSVVKTSWAGEQFMLPQSSPAQLPVKGWLTEDAALRLMRLGGKKLAELRAAAERRDFHPVPLGVRISTQFSQHVQQKTSANVLAVLPGSDPRLSKEVVLYTAHHDHLGKKADARPGEDAIYNGAVDNASGVAELLALARAFRKLPKPPRRSIVFAAIAAEEQGLLGSQYLTEHLPFSPGHIAANINLDGANVWGRTRDVVVVGIGKSNLDTLVEQIAHGQGRMARPDPFPDRGFFYRSDQYSFAKIGVPSVYAQGGVEFIGRPEAWGRDQREKWEATRYHQTSDEFDPNWDLLGMVEDTQLYFQLGMRIADGDELPKWNPGDEFEPARLRALGAKKDGSLAPGGR